MRLFTALKLPDLVRDHLWGIGQAANDKWYGHYGADSGLRWKKSQNLHVTLKFLGSVDDAIVPRLIEALREAERGETITLACVGLLLLPPRGPVRIVAATLGGDVGRLSQLYESVEEVVERFEVPGERRAYTPHVTLARCGKQPVTARREQLRLSIDERWPGPSWECRSFALIQSVLDADGATYTKLAEFRA